MVAIKLSIHGHGAGRWAIQPENQPHRRRLAGAIRTKKACYDAGLNTERQPVDGALVTVILREILRLDHTATLPTALVKRR